MRILWTVRTMRLHPEQPGSVTCGQTQSSLRAGVKQVDGRWGSFEA